MCFNAAKLNIIRQEMKLLVGLLVALGVLIGDQITKYYIMNYMFHEQPILKLTSFFNLVYAWNTGVSFSMFNNLGTVGVILLCVLASGIVITLLWWLYHEKNLTMQIGLGLIIGGALGNITDRVRFGAVFDFLDFHFAEHHWPAFNVADSCICIGAAVIIVYNFVCSEKKENKEKCK